MPTAQYPAFQPYQSFAPTDPNAVAKTSHDILANAVPGLDKLNSSAAGNVGQQLGGLPSASPVQRANAYFGVNSGMPGSDFVRNRGFDLYGEKADAYKARGFDDFLALLKGVSGTVAPTTGEQTALQQQNQSLQQQTTQNNSAIGAQNSQSALQLRQQGVDRWNASKRGDYTTTDSLGLTPLFGYGSGR
jgi:hypothetical protein